MVQHLIGMSPGCLPVEVFQKGANLEEIKNMLEGLYIPCGLGTPQDSSRGSGGSS